MIEDNFNAQTRALRSAVELGRPLLTRRDQVLGQLILCEGCCCGRVERGFPELPKDVIKARWKELRLNSVIQLTISGCLGPCDLANVACIMSADGRCEWLGGLSEAWQYEALICWAEECQRKGRFLALPATLTAHRFERFERPSTQPQACSRSPDAITAHPA